MSLSFILQQKHTDWPTANATIIKSISFPTTYIPKRHYGSTSAYEMSVTYQYVIDNKSIRNSDILLIINIPEYQATLKKYKKDNQILIHYNPDTPQQSFIDEPNNVEQRQNSNRFFYFSSLIFSLLMLPIIGFVGSWEDLKKSQSNK